MYATARFSFQKATMRKKVKKPAITITELLAINRTADCRRLLKEHGMPDATSYAELQDKLIQLYSNTEDKRAIEQKIASMHPHKDFILKYFSPVKEDIKVQPVAETNPPVKVIANDWSGNEGNRFGYNQQYLNACGCGGSHGFDGTGPARANGRFHNVNDDKFITVLCIAALVIGTAALTTAIMHNKFKH